MVNPVYFVVHKRQIQYPPYSYPGNTQLVLALETNEKANSCEPFIEVDDTLNKLKNGNVIQDILDNDDEYLILKGISSKLTRNLLETFENNSEIDIKS